MKKYLVTMFFLLCSQAALAGSISVLTYHDVVPDTSHDNYAVSRSAFVAQMDYLQLNGYTPVSLSYLDEVRQGNASLPGKPVLLTFDDGMASYHDFVVPLLKIYGFPSVASVVTGWLDGENIPAEYQGRLMNWKQLAQISNNKLVEIISHTHNLHIGIRSNPQGNKEAASITRQFIASNNTYESEALYQQRITRDLKQSQERIKEKLGFTPDAIAWPYGYYNSDVSNIASRLGFRYQLTLEQGPARIEKMPMVNRIILFAGTTIKDFENELNYRHNNDNEQHFVELQLDAFIGKNYLQQESMLDRLLDGLEQAGVNTIIVSPFTQDMTRAFFVNDEFELAADILNRTLHLIKAKLPVHQVYLKLPGDPALDEPDVFYLQMARLNWFNGVVFNDNPGKDNLELVKSILGRLQPGMQYGLGISNKDDAGRIPDPALDFYLLSVPMHELNEWRETAPGLLASPDQRILFMFNQLDDDDLTGINDAITQLRKSGIRHFGFTPFNYDLENTVNASLFKEADDANNDGGG